MANKPIYATLATRDKVIKHECTGCGWTGTHEEKTTKSKSGNLGLYDVCPKCLKEEFFGIVGYKLKKKKP